jgi:hypothetical protein
MRPAMALASSSGVRREVPTRITKAEIKYGAKAFEACFASGV